MRPGLVIALTALLNWPAFAAAQNNSLLGTGRRPPTSQPASGEPATAFGPSVMGVRTTLTAERPDPKPNATLLHFSPYAVAKPEPAKIKMHDVITVIVRESKTATTDSKLESKRDWKLDSALDKFIRLSDRHGVVPAQFNEGKPAVLFDFKNDYKGNGSYDRKDELTTRVSAKVIDVKPNGNLVLEATKRITIDDEGYTIALTGECRSKDVTPDNTILSTQLADPVIAVQHSGAVRDATRRGWLMRAMDLFRLF